MGRPGDQRSRDVVDVLDVPQLRYGVLAHGGILGRERGLRGLMDVRSPGARPLLRDRGRDREDASAS